MTDISAGPPSVVAPEPLPPPPMSRLLPSGRRRPWLLAGALAVFLLAALALMTWRRPAVAPTSPPAAATEPTPVALAETMGEEGHLTIAVVSLDRVAPDTLELRLAVTNTAPPGTPALDLTQRFSADGPDRGTLAEVYLADLSHERKFFVLRDGQNAPLGSRETAPLGPGERRVLWARFPAPADAESEVVVHVPHAEPMPNVPVAQKAVP